MSLQLVCERKKNYPDWLTYSKLMSALKKGGEEAGLCGNYTPVSSSYRQHFIMLWKVTHKRVYNLFTYYLLFSYLSYVTKIEQMTGFWRAMNRPERWFLLNAPLPTWWQNNLQLQLDFWKHKKGPWVLEHDQPNVGVVPTVQIRTCPTIKQP